MTYYIIIINFNEFITYHNFFINNVKIFLLVVHAHFYLKLN